MTGLKFALGIAATALAVCLGSGNAAAQSAELHVSLAPAPELTAAREAVESGDGERAVQLFRRVMARKLSGNSAYAAYANYCAALNMVGRYQDAIDSCREAIALQPGRWQAHNNLGMALHSSGRYAEAIEAFSAALRRSPDNRRILRNRMISELAQGEMIKADLPGDFIGATAI